MLKNAPIMPTIPVADAARAKQFYEGVLGFSAKEEMPGGIVYDSGNGTYFFTYPSAGAGTSTATYASWQVDNLESEITNLKTKGVVFEEYDMPGLKTENSIMTAGDVKAAWFKDTEGNILGLIQRM